MILSFYLFDLKDAFYIVLFVCSFKVNFFNFYSPYQEVNHPLPRMIPWPATWRKIRNQQLKYNPSFEKIKKLEELKKILKAKRIHESAGSFFLGTVIPINQKTCYGTSNKITNTHRFQNDYPQKGSLCQIPNKKASNNSQFIPCTYTYKFPEKEIPTVKKKVKHFIQHS